MNFSKILLYIVIGIVLAIGTLLALSDNMKSVSLQFTWDKYDMTIPENSRVTHLQIWDVSADSPKLVEDNISVSDTESIIKFPADGKTYTFAMRAVTADTFSVFSNTCSVSMPYRPIPFTVKGFTAKILGD